MYCSVISWTVSMTMELPALLLHSTMYIAFSVCMWWHMAINKQMVPWVLKLMKLGGWWGITNLVPFLSPTAITLFLSVTSVIFHCCNNCNCSLQVLNLFLFPAILMHQALCAFPWVLVGQKQHTAIADGKLFADCRALLFLAASLHGRTNNSYAHAAAPSLVWMLI